MDITNKFLKRKPVIAAGIGLILIGFLIMGLSLWEALGSVNNRFMTMELPGFHEMSLKTPGPYVGVYQHASADPLPIANLMNFSVRLTKTDSAYAQEIPVSMNTSGQTFSQFGLVGMALFTFSIDEPGMYALSGVYVNDKVGPPMTILLMSQAAQDMKPTILVGLVFFALFVALGIWVIVKSKKWSGMHT